MSGDGRIGEQIGRYRIDSVIGQGGFASVYRAQDTVLDRPVALKMLDATALRDPTNSRRFLREGRTAANLDHPAVVPVYDAGEDDGVPWLAMRLVNGGALDQHVVAGRSFTATETLALVRRIASALDHAHGQGLVHRDVKPSNILLEDGKAGAAWLTDFGIAVTARNMGLYTTGALGTAAYMAPEQARPNQAGPSADLYSLGCVAYELLTGRRPFPGEDYVGLLMAHANDPVPPTGVAAIDELMTKTLAKDTDERPRSGSALAQRLAEALDSAPADELTTLEAEAAEAAASARASTDESEELSDAAPDAPLSPPVAVAVPDDEHQAEPEEPAEDDVQGEEDQDEKDQGEAIEQADDAEQGEDEAVAAEAEPERAHAVPAVAQPTMAPEPGDALTVVDESSRTVISPQSVPLPAGAPSQTPSGAQQALPQAAQQALPQAPGQSTPQDQPQAGAIPAVQPGPHGWPQPGAASPQGGQSYQPGYAYAGGPSSSGGRPAAYPIPTRRRRHISWVFTAIGAVLLVVAGGAYFLMEKSPEATTGITDSDLDTGARKAYYEYPAAWAHTDDETGVVIEDEDGRSMISVSHSAGGTRDAVEDLEADERCEEGPATALEPVADSDSTARCDNPDGSIAIGTVAYDNFWVFKFDSEVSDERRDRFLESLEFFETQTNDEAD